MISPTLLLSTVDLLHFIGYSPPKSYGAVKDATENAVAIKQTLILVLQILTMIMKMRINHWRFLLQKNIPLI